MRSPADRLRHAISFEVIGLALLIPVGSLLFGLAIEKMGVFALGASLTATLWNYVYNLGFDHAMQRLAGHTRKTPLLRVFHAVLFEAGLLCVLLPPTAWFLGISLWQAFVMDASIAVFYVAYAFVFNLAYDRLFPLPEWQEKACTP
ncbi:PACE efflux transporter [Pseudoroseomonas globiformis]|uniref:PACE efflux transporter n=1 Tax=Teichococcus globiformis TaxID=2307229 RepID=A0ABV7G9W9_9PROT